mmetsp:Transcript_4192/g.9092  ORF Transcript_4192/g.9092 Transcript_4192/m.9092 type:complete len:123 (+) Transcript_4192:333-701(+)
MLNGTAVGSTPFSFCVLPDEAAAISVDVSGLRTAVRNTPVNFVAMANDQFGNVSPMNRRFFSVRLRPPLADSKMVPSVAIHEQADGSMICDFVPKALGRHQLQVSYARLPLVELACVILCED